MQSFWDGEKSFVAYSLATREVYFQQSAPRGVHGRALQKRAQSFEAQGKRAAEMGTMNRAPTKSGSGVGVGGGADGLDAWCFRGLAR
jgi:hypothetical protein